MRLKSFSSFAFASIFSLGLSFFSGAARASDPVNGVNGWHSAAVNFNVQWPYDQNESARYSYDSSTGVYHLWVYNTDKPFTPGSTTLPRTEQRFTPDYTHGEIQYAADMMVPSDTNACCIFQIHTADSQQSQYGSTAMMLFWYSKNGGSVFQHSGTQLVTGLVGQYFHLNVDHNLNTHKITVWINSHQVWQGSDNGASDYYFKDGVYAQSGASTKMENHVKNIHIWTHS